MNNNPENTERFEPLEKVVGEKIFIDSIYYKRGYQFSREDIWLRSGAAKKVRQAAQLLPANIGLVLWDGWRSLKLQAELYQEYRDKIAAKSGLSGDELDLETRKFVAFPGQNPPPPHSTGGTIDLSLCDLDGNPLDMGGEFDQLDQVSRTDFYQSGPIYKRRQLLLNVMHRAGFLNYPEEWWHFNSQLIGSSYKYGLIENVPNRD
jgi:D-alanyl-D-alanine dipeptidase